jgi:hypothetical protein
MDYGAIIGMIGSALGEAQAGKLSAQQQRILEDMYGQLRDLPLPELEKLKAEQLGPTAMEGVHSDPSQRQSELETLGELRDLFEHGGFNLEDRAALNEAMNRSNVIGSAQRHALAGEYAQRGQLGSGARLAMGNMDAQGAANRSSQAAQDVSARGEARRQGAMRDYADLAAHIRGQDFSEASARANAHDAADRWNAGARENAAKYNAGLAQQQFSNSVTKATGQQSAGNNLAAYFGNEAQGTRNQYANYSGAAATAFGNGGGGGGGNSRPINSDDPNDVYSRGTDYGSSNPDEWNNPYGGY